MLKLETIHLGIVFEDNTGASYTYSPGDIAGCSINILDGWRRYVLIDVGEPATIELFHQFQKEIAFVL